MSVPFRICTTALRTSLLKSQRMMGMTWRTPSSTPTEKAGSSNWVSPSWCTPGLFLFNQSCWQGLYHCHCMIFCFIAALCTFFSPKKKKLQKKPKRNITSNVFGTFENLLSFCMASSVISQALKSFWIFFPLPVSLSPVFLFPVIRPPVPFFQSLLAPALLDLWFLCCCWCCSPFRRYVQPLFPY